MNDAPDNSLSHRTADLPLAARRRLDVEWQRDLGDGLTRRHLAVEQYRQRYVAAQLARALHVGPALKAALDRLGKREG